MSQSPPALAVLGQTLYRLQPEGAGSRLLLFGIRQIGSSGLYDAATAHAFVTAFGKGFRRPLLMLRTLMAEMSGAASGPIQIAPWCCARVTPNEGALLDLIALSTTDPCRARILLADLLGARHVDGMLATSAGLAQAFSDLGLPLDG
ncbi:DUF6628 family protein [Sphingomonas turrisvirgatae]|uniref:Uncharacterized protein n=1 Tax=Sphingomonas turrisvirgatae TaxID=1888892 RepID=A0A1E3M0F1_9SPHN|nr:DUF6628 family protein [Sphingomonas turrisvirgatae]ODP39463.1 hypothetical protein BFL28_10365 [Sphingomonas turrisvirgatae]